MMKLSGNVVLSRTNFCGPNEPKHGPIKALNLHRDPKGNQRWTKQLERKKNRLNFSIKSIKETQFLMVVNLVELMSLNWSKNYLAVI